MSEKPLGPVESGGDVRLTGFSELDPGERDEAMKVVAHYEHRLKEICTDIEFIKLTLKKIHHTQKSEKYELHGSVKDRNGHYEAQVVDRKLFAAVSSVLKKIENEIAK